MCTKTIASSTPAKRRILIIEKHPLVRRGLTALIDNEPDLTVCAEAATQRAGVEAIASFQPDLVIADLLLEDGADLGLVKAIRSRNQELPVLVLSLHDSPCYVHRALQIGAKGYVSKQEMGETLLTAIRCVLRGEEYVSPKIRSERDRI